MKTKLQRFEDSRNLKRMCIDHFGGECSRCGLKDDIPDVYDFHHRENKEHNVSRLIANKATIVGITSIPQEILDELNKCDLVCATCHRRITYLDKLARIKQGFSAFKDFKGGRKINPSLHRRVRSLKAEGLGATAIARQLGCTRANVYSIMSRATLPRTSQVNAKPKGRPANQNLRNQIQSMLADGMSGGQIAKKLKCSRANIYSFLKRMKPQLIAAS